MWAKDLQSKHVDIHLEDHCSAFKKVEKYEHKPKSFIVVRNKPSKAKKPYMSCFESTDVHSLHHKSMHEDSDSTHHSNHQVEKKVKLSKDEKRHMYLNSIRKLIESRKIDTLNELEKFSDDDVVLHKSPKPVSKNSKLSSFRGVSNNGRKWQVMIMGFAKKIYFGGIPSEVAASHKYDKYAVLMHGLEAKTNYDYTKRELCQILNSEIDEE